VEELETVTIEAALKRIFSSVRCLVLLLSVLFPFSLAAAGEAPATRDLAGRWVALVQVGKVEFKLILKVAVGEDGRVTTTISMPDSGMGETPVEALLYNHPEVRIEIDQFRTAFHGRLNESGDAIEGEFEEGPGGRPLAMVLRRSSEEERVEPVLSYSFEEGEARDFRGYWRGEVEMMPGMPLRLGLRIGREESGAFHVLLDNLDLGMQGVPASTATFEEGLARLTWNPLQLEFEARLETEANELAGSMKQGQRRTSATLIRSGEPMALWPEGSLLEPDPADPADIRGDWHGTLTEEGRRLRLHFRIGRAPDGQLAATMTSLDQGAREIPAHDASFTPPELRLEWKALRGVYTGSLGEDGGIIEGTWEQWGKKNRLQLERGSSPATGP
jgi:hypothetical protein